jgi:hypothetical protein
MTARSAVAANFGGAGLSVLSLRRRLFASYPSFRRIREAEEQLQHIESIRRPMRAD